MSVLPFDLSEPCLFLCISLTLILYCIGADRQNTLLQWLTKPTIMVFVIQLAQQRQEAILSASSNEQALWNDRYAYITIVGLIFGVIGDVLLLADFFIFGLVSFLFNHFAYILNLLSLPFPETLTLPMMLPYLIPSLILAGSLGSVYLKNIKSKTLKVAVFIYISIITIMMCRCTVYYLNYQTFAHVEKPQENNLMVPSANMILIGGIFFFISDGILGYDRFVSKVPGRNWLVMFTYIIAQTAFAYSIPKYA